ncbi:RNA binding [Sparganum proliferum]
MLQCVQGFNAPLALASLLTLSEGVGVMSSSVSWPEVRIASEEHRHELVLSGPEILKRVEATGLDDLIFSLKQLNFLEISRSGISTLPDDIQNLSDLTKLSLQHNALTQIPAGLGNVHHLRFLDLSFNSISNLPENLFNNLSQLESLTLDSNELQSLPSLKGLVGLHVLSVSSNKLAVLPETLSECSKLMSVDFSRNALTSLPTDLNKLTNLHRLNVCDNNLTEIPSTLGECRKLRECLLERNPLKDNRLKKMASDPRSSLALIAYLGKKGKSTSAKGTRSVSRTPRRDLKPQDLKPNHLSLIELDTGMNHDAYTIRVIDPESVRASLRPRIFACTVAGVIFRDETVLKDFLRFQVKLHNDLGQQRRVATLCTHDEAFVRLPLTYSINPVDSISIHALNMGKPKTARDLLLRLQLEAESERKRRKLTQFSSLQRYLELISPSLGPGKDSIAAAHSVLPPLPVTVDSAHTTLSLHPITSCHETRLTLNTSTVLLEVAGTDAEVCKRILRALIGWLIKYASSASPDNGGAEDQSESKAEATTAQSRLILRPFRVVNAITGDRLAQYPTAADVANEQFLADM